MKQALLVVLGGLVLLSIPSLSPFVAAAPPLKPTPPTSALPTATPESQDDSGQTVGPEIAAPEAVVSPGTMTSKIIVFNPDTGTATVRIELRNPDGSLITPGISDFTVVGNGAKVVTLPSSVPSPFTGSAVVSADKNVQAYVLDANSNNTARDSYDGLGGADTSLSLPLVRHLHLAGQTQRTLIGVQNTGGAPTNATVHLYNQDGSENGSSPIALSNIAPAASQYVDTTSIFASADFSGTAEIDADAGGTIAVAEQSQYYQDTASFRGLNSSDQGTTVNLPFFERRIDSTGKVTQWTEIFVRNNGSAAADITAKFYSTGGTLKQTVTRAAIPANGQARFLTKDSEFSGMTNSTSTSLTGWVQITSAQPVAVYALDAQGSGNRLFGYAGIPTTRLGVKFVCGDTYRYTSSPTQITKLAIVNLGSSAASITVRLYKASTGAQLASKSTSSLSPNKVWSVSLSDSSFSNAGSTFEGMAVVTASTSQIGVVAYTPYGSNSILSASCNRLQ